MLLNLKGEVIEVQDTKKGRIFKVLQREDGKADVVPVFCNLNPDKPYPGFKVGDTYSGKVRCQGLVFPA